MYKSRDCDVLHTCGIAMAIVYSLAMWRGQKLYKLLQCIQEWNFNDNKTFHYMYMCSNGNRGIFLFIPNNEKILKMHRELFVALLSVVRSLKTLYKVKCQKTSISKLSR